MIAEAFSLDPVLVLEETNKVRRAARIGAALVLHNQQEKNKRAASRAGR